ncbi:MAG: Asp-tRNA(Asn)/Glu-tRNA(Gln) amidotransferase subunit GatC [Thermodesulfobacteriota bacterium]|nr:Asp-tRNA(Asn)/Glu-tRNA(Gln) amidotransferase subunit GatC [Thermodesulfobacteriota bacterium]
MKIDRQEVEHVARLARLRITAQEADRLTGQMNSILAYMDKLNDLDTTGIEPMAHALPLTNAFREDEVRPSLDTDKVLDNAPESQGTFFLVPKVI